MTLHISDGPCRALLNRVPENIWNTQSVSLPIPTSPWAGRAGKWEQGHWDERNRLAEWVSRGCKKASRAQNEWRGAAQAANSSDQGTSNGEDLGRCESGARGQDKKSCSLEGIPKGESHESSSTKLESPNLSDPSRRGHGNTKSLDYYESGIGGPNQKKILKFFKPWRR